MKVVDGKNIYIGYCVGSIHHAKDREHAFDASERAITDAGHIALNPVKEEPEKTGMSCTGTEEQLNTFWSKGQFAEYRKLMDEVYDRDVNNVRKADYLVLHFEDEDSSVGAPLEMTIASLAYIMRIVRRSCSDIDKTWIKAGMHSLEQAGFFHKPIYWVCTGPISKINTTLKWLVLSGSDVRVFKTYKELTDHLKKEYK